jgi:hypothetical protein
MWRYALLDGCEQVFLEEDLDYAAYLSDAVVLSNRDRDAALGFGSS